jgi:hypothetical protein
MTSSASATSIPISLFIHLINGARFLRHVGVITLAARSARS